MLRVRSRRWVVAALLATVVIAVLTGCSSSKPATPTAVVVAATSAPSFQPTARATVPSSSASADTSAQSGVDYTADVTFTLETALSSAGLSFVGKGGTIEGKANPTLEVKVSDTVKITLVNGDGVIHDLSFPDFNAHSDQLVAKGSSDTIAFKADTAGTFAYFCTLPGHRQAGMEGKLIVGSGAQVTAPTGVSIVRDPTDLPGPLNRTQTANVKVELTAMEVEGNLADGATYTYWTFDAKVPGPFFRVRVGDTVEVHMKNADNSKNIHSVDFHAVTEPGGGGRP